MGICKILIFNTKSNRTDDGEGTSEKNERFSNKTLKRYFRSNVEKTVSTIYDRFREPLEFLYLKKNK